MTNRYHVLNVEDFFCQSLYHKKFDAIPVQFFVTLDACLYTNSLKKKIIITVVFSTAAYVT